MFISVYILLQSTDIISVITFAYLVAFPFSLIFEAPFIGLDKIFLTPKSLKSEHATRKKAPEFSRTPSVQDDIPHKTLPA